MFQGCPLVTVKPLYFLLKQAYSLANGSAVAVSKLNLAFTEYDDGSVYRCVATSSIMAAHEEKPQAEITLSVQFK